MSRKVNPVMCENLMRVAARVICNDGCIIARAAAHLVFVQRNPPVLGDFPPVTFFPFFVAAFRSLLSLSAVIGLLRESRTSSTDISESVMLMGMSFLPLLFGLIASLPGFMIVAVGRAQVVWKATATTTFAANKKTASKSRRNTYGDHEIQEEAERFLTKISSPRE